MKPYTVITEPTGWSFIVRADGSRDGPWRYRWEAEEVAEDLMTAPKPETIDP